MNSIRWLLIITTTPGDAPQLYTGRRVDKCTDTKTTLLLAPIQMIARFLNKKYEDPPQAYSIDAWCGRALRTGRYDVRKRHRCSSAQRQFRRSK